jgi:Nop14-like family
VKGVDYDPDRERVGEKRLRKKIRDEKKGAIRELRKDNETIEYIKVPILFCCFCPYSFLQPFDP